MISKENIEALIEFGGLLVYEIRSFHSTFWKERVELRTFNEEYAKEEFKSLKADKNPYIAYQLVSYMVQFNYK